MSPGLIPMPNRWVSGYLYERSKGSAVQKKKKKNKAICDFISYSLILYLFISPIKYFKLESRH
jgi:hypothetical protein